VNVKLSFLMIRRKSMKKWYAEEYNFEIAVTGFLRSDHREN